MDILDFFSRQPIPREVLDYLKKNKGNIYIGNSTNNVNKLLAASYYQEFNQTVVYVTSNIYHATKAYDTFLNLLPADKVSFFPVDEFVASELISSTQGFKVARMNTIKKILNGEPQVIITNTDGITRNVMSLEKQKEAILEIEVGSVIKMDDLIKKLVMRGYMRTSVTEKPGDFSVRGSLIDVFPINCDRPVRIDFFDIEVESIRIFDQVSQLSIEKIKSILIYPFYELVYNESDIPFISENILKNVELSDKIEKDLNDLRNYRNLDRLYRYLPFIDPNYLPFLDIINSKIVMYDNYQEIKEKEEQNYFEIGEYLLNQKDTFAGTSNFFYSVGDLLSKVETNIFLNNLMAKLEEIKLTKLFDMKTYDNSHYYSNVKNLIEELRINKDKTYILTHIDSQKITFFQELLNSNNIYYQEAHTIDDIKTGKINLVVSENAIGFASYDSQLEVITPDEISPKRAHKRSKFRKLYEHATQVYTKEELVKGDYVVHQDYGIGQYFGIKTIELGGVKNDYIVVKYAEDNVLYVPVENIYVLEKYLGSEDYVPKLTKLGTKDWEKKKNRIKAQLESIARKLIETQAKRELLKGFVYQSYPELERAFAEDFEFEETPDQKKAIQEVEQDMLSDRPMDRLICGDVGFGKTEVAMRAAFKAVLNDKQVAYLAPTTVLSRQHYYTFKERFEKYGVRVELMNRFVEDRVQKNIINGLQNGYVDIVIGTHRILSRDIKFKDLGILIIDEEHRFGVEQKERIKELKANVDILSLSATPIPRTLQMSLMGMRDLSLLETAPSNRYPVQTYVIEQNDAVIREAINRELARDGQVFYLHNRISNLDRIERKIRSLVPSSRIATIHGKLDKEEIEKVMAAFLEGEYNVLICTTIIETGIDIPNSNTIIISDAHRLGLAQIYQIRGRVGRSDRIAYAYLMYEGGKVLTETSQKRLETIKEFTALGSGYKIAMRDLSIRGAGDVLGREQSGFIDAIGIDLYMRMLKEAIDKEKGIVREVEPPKRFEIKVSKHIDNNYVSDDMIKIEIHQKINRVTSREIQKELIKEFTDRYGVLSDDVKLYIEEQYLEHLLKAKGVESFKEAEDEVTLNFDPEKSKQIDGQKLFLEAMKLSPKIKFEFKNRRIFIKIRKSDFLPSYINILTILLEKM